MKAIAIRAYGGPEELKFDERPDPVYGPGEVLVRVAATSVIRSIGRFDLGSSRTLSPLPSRADPCSHRTPKTELLAPNIVNIHHWTRFRDLALFAATARLDCYLAFPKITFKRLGRRWPGVPFRSDKSDPRRGGAPHP